MKIRGLLFNIFVLILSLFACHRQASKSVENTNVKPFGRNDSVYEIFSLQRTGCLGACPIYDFHIFSNGTARYHGTANVDRLGHFQATVSDNQMDGLWQQIGLSHFFDLSPVYSPSNIVVYDLPVTTTIVNLQGNISKVVDKSYGSPKELQDLEKYTDKLIQQLVWEPTDK